LRVRGYHSTSAPSYLHSEDELIDLAVGELPIGRLNLLPGQRLFVAGGFQYGFRSSGPLEFDNHRPDVATIQLRARDEPRLETVAASQARPVGY
jgi:hypothetical protein